MTAGWPGPYHFSPIPPASSPYLYHNVNHLSLQIYNEGRERKEEGEGAGASRSREGGKEEEEKKGVDTLYTYQRVVIDRRTRVRSQVAATRLQ